MPRDYHSGFVALVGKPNVGKSTLMNHIVGQKISITSRKPQTTRHQILGVSTTDDCQIVFVDTPGMHVAKGKLLNRVMNRAARGSLADVDLVLFVVNAGEDWTEDDEAVMASIARENRPTILVANKIDRLAKPDQLLPFLEKVRQQYNFIEILPVSAIKGIQLAELRSTICANLPQQEMLYPEDQLTDKNERFVVSELIREQIFRQAGQEVPYSVAVEIERYKEEGKRLEIDAVIYVEKPGQKAILIGKNGARIKSIGTAAREAIQKFLGRKVHLQTWVKVKEKWSDDVRALKSLGYGE